MKFKLEYHPNRTLPKFGKALLFEEMIVLLNLFSGDSILCISVGILSDDQHICIK